VIFYPKGSSPGSGNHIGSIKSLHQKATCLGLLSCDTEKPALPKGLNWFSCRKYELEWRDQQILAGRVGFEPTLVLPKLVFETSTFNHSVTSPYSLVKVRRLQPLQAQPPTCLVTSARLERATFSSAGKRSNPLSYEALFSIAVCFTSALSTCVIIPYSLKKSKSVIFSIRKGYRASI
jgi:hypothetical protein